MHEPLFLLPPAAALNPGAVLELLAAMAAIVIVFVLPPVRRAIFAPTRADSPGNVRPMSRAGLLAAYGVIALIVGGSLFDLIRDKEHWPWSNFPMYSQVSEQGATFSDYRLYGVVKKDQSEICLNCDGRYLQPFDPSRMTEALTTLAGDPKLHEGLADCLRRYELLRQSGGHDGPELSGLRMYRVTFTLDADGRNIDQPDAKQLIDQVTFAGGKIQ
jgi:hypothetical protein